MGWVMWGHVEASVRKNDTWGRNVRNGGERQQNHLVKHFTVKSASDLSTQFSVCLSSDNWMVVSVYTEPQEDRKHILAGLDRLDNGRKKEQLLSGDNRKGARGELQCVYAPVNALRVFALTRLLACLSRPCRVPAAARPADRERSHYRCLQELDHCCVLTSNCTKDLCPLQWAGGWWWKVK